MLNGLLGKKIGMTQVYDAKGDVVPVTVVEAGPCYVMEKRSESSKVQVGFGSRKRVIKPVAGKLKKAGVEAKLEMFMEFKADKIDELAIGQAINVGIFKEGEIVNVQGTSIGKGFAGTVKRYHFTRGPMSHGSKSHRLVGSIGAGTTPGRVYKGKKMAGRMGGETVTVRNLQVVKIDTEKNLILIKGAVPGVEGSVIVIRKGKKNG